MFAAYYDLVKPGIIYGNAIAAAAGFFVASAGAPDLQLLAVMLVGLSLVIASGCVFNNYLDRDLDAHMERTKGRALVRGAVPPNAALVYGATLGVAGLAVLILFVNLLAALVALGGFVVYIGVYTLLVKRRSPYATHVGAIAGAVPPVVGYIAVLGRLDLGAFILFLILAFWQLPHFFAIALYRKDDYVAADIPVLPIARGVRAAKIESAWAVLAFLFAAFALAAAGYAGDAYGLAALVLGLGWFALALSGFAAPDERRWARHMFIASLIVLMTLCVFMAADARAPMTPLSSSLTTA